MPRSNTLVFTGAINTRTTTTTASDAKTAGSQKLNTSISTINIRSQTPATDLNRTSFMRLNTLTENTAAAEQKSNATTWVSTKNPRVPRTHLQVGQYYQTEKNSIHRASRIARSAGSAAPAKKTKSTRIF